MFVINKIQQLLDGFFNLIHRYVLEIIILMFIILFFLWTVAFIGNGLYGYHFDLQSCWGGFSAIGGAGVMAAIKYCMDSWKNSPEGEMPHSIKGTVIDFLSSKTNVRETEIKKT